MGSPDACWYYRPRGRCPAGLRYPVRLLVVVSTTDAKRGRRQHTRFLFLLLLATFFSFSFVAGDVGGLQTGSVKMPVFTLLVGFGFLMLLGGFVFGQSFLVIVGCVLFFICGFVINNGELSYSTGSTVTTVGAVTTITETYAAWNGENSHLVGWLLMVSSLVLFTIALLNSGGGDDY